LALQSTQQGIERGIALLQEGSTGKATVAIEANDAEEADEAEAARVATGENEAVC
jgi:hypothetical protein